MGLKPSISLFRESVVCSDCLSFADFLSQYTIFNTCSHDFCICRTSMHLFFFNLSLKKWYNPGLLTTLVGLVPVSVYYLAHDWKLYSGLDWFLG
ncbi:TPA: HXXEE domain-containing protein [Streptococcus agalactiae]